MHVLRSQGALSRLHLRAYAAADAADASIAGAFSEHRLPGAGGQDVQRPGYVSPVGPGAGVSRKRKRRSVVAEAGIACATAAVRASADERSGGGGSTLAAGVRADAGDVA